LAEQDARTGLNMPTSTKPITILIADDDADDRQLLREAFAESQNSECLQFVEDGVEVFDYLGQTGKYTDRTRHPWPSILLLDLNMPRMDGREVLQRLRTDFKYCPIRVIVMTTSKAEEDVLRSYQLCAASYITKPAKFESLVEIVRSIGNYWCRTVELIDHDTKCRF
jgi:CheY-like chemotaxis protein